MRFDYSMGIFFGPDLENYTSSVRELVIAIESICCDCLKTLMRKGHPHLVRLPQLFISDKDIITNLLKLPIPFCN